MNGKYVILVRNSPQPPPPVAVESDEFDFGDEPEWEAVEYSFSDDWLAPAVNTIAAGDFEPVLLKAKIKYGVVYRYGDWNMPWWLAWKSTRSSMSDGMDRAAAEYASKKFVRGLVEIDAL